MPDRTTERTLTRRRLIGTGAGAAAGLALGGVPGALAKHRSGHRHPDRHLLRANVVVVGAGLAGLTAARNVVHAKRSVIVLEARNRVGGRVLNHELGHGVISEGGGTFAGPTQNRILALAQRMGVNTFPTFDQGDNVFIGVGGNRITYSDTGITGTAPPDPLLLPDLATIIIGPNGLDELSKSVPVDAPWKAPRAAEWDRQTLQDYIDSQPLVNPHAFKPLVPATTRPIFGAEPDQLSLLFVLFYIAASGNENNPGTFERNFDTRGGAQMWRFHGGSQLIAERQAKRLGHRVMLGSPVRRIERLKGGVRVISDRVEVAAKRVIVAVPPEVAGFIRYDPKLPAARAKLNRRLHQGSLIKASAVYKEPFWRDAGLNGSALWTGGPVSFTFDDSPPSGRPGIVFGFIGGDNARAHRKLGKAARRKAVLENFVQFFGSKAAKPTDYFETDWSNSQWTRGCPVGIAGPGVYTAYGPALRKPVGRIHWAGTETSTFWNGYMDGAVRSGERAAGEVVDDL
jgi:monoamine oxidase